MYSGFTPRRLAHFVLTSLFAGALAGGSGCHGRPEPYADALRLGFPEQAARVLDGSDAFLHGAEGFALDPAHDRTAPSRGRGGLTATLPDDGAEAVRFQLPDGFEARVVEEGAQGSGAALGRAVAYARAGGTSYWAATETGYEEWLLLEAGRARGDRIAASWRVEGATVRQQGAAIELGDASGAVRVRVTAPEAYAASGRPVAARLAAEGTRIDLVVDAGGESVLVDPAWTSAGSMSAPHEHHTATLLGDGRVLIAGGTNGGAASAVVDVYDPTANAWGTPSTLAKARTNHAATVLQNGKVLVTGGSNLLALASAELYDPTAGTWSATGQMLSAREHHAAVLLGDNTVLAMGGSGTFTLIAAETYNPATGMWTGTTPMTKGRSFHTATVLTGGKVLVAGGVNNQASAEVYDPTNMIWVATKPMLAVRASHTATLLPDGRVLVTGGFSTLASAELYDATTNAWTAAAPMSAGRYFHTATLLSNGRVLVTGGQSGTTPAATAEIYDPMTDKWAAVSPMTTARTAHTATLLTGGGLLAAGGDDGTGSLATAEIYGLAAAGVACTLAGDCASGFCVDGVCCDTACGAGMPGGCHACSKAAGAAIDGTCAPLDGPACDDSDACTSNDTCHAGTCAGSVSVTCPPAASCHDMGVCDPMTGMCSASKVQADGATCDDTQKCTQNDQCNNGFCVGTPVVCPGPDECHLAGSCNPATGMCNLPVKLDGTPCSAGECLKGICGPIPGTASNGAGGSGTGGGSGGNGGCGCDMAGSSPAGALWLGAGLLLVVGRRRGRPGSAGTSA